MEVTLLICDPKGATRRLSHVHPGYGRVKKRPVFVVFYFCTFVPDQIIQFDVCSIIKITLRPPNDRSAPSFVLVLLKSCNFKCLSDFSSYPSNFPPNWVWKLKTQLYHLADKNKCQRINVHQIWFYKSNSFVRQVGKCHKIFVKSNLEIQLTNISWIETWI